MEELQCIDIILYLHYRAVEGKRVIDDLLQRLGIDVLSEEGIGYRIGNLLKRLGFDGVEEVFWQLLDLLRHIETAIFCQTFHHCFM